MSVRESFVAHFGEDEATRVEEASLMHLNITPGEIGQFIAAIGLDQDRREMNWGSDPFKWHMRNAITHECLVRPEFRAAHGIHTPANELKLWCQQYGDLNNFDGDDPDPVLWTLDDELTAGWI